MVESCTVKVIKYILFIGCIVSLILFVMSGFWIASYPFGLDFGEGYLLEHARLIGEGKNIYGNINSYPYTVCNYAPVYPLITGIIMNIGEISLTTGRWVSIIATLACCWLIGFIILRQTRNQLLSLILGMMFVCIPAVFRWGQIMRVDTLAVALSLGGLAVYMVAGNDRRRLWCIPFLIAAFLTKQSMLAAPIAILIHRFTIDRKSGMTFTAITVVSGAIVYLIINLLTDWGIFRHNFLYTANAFYFSRFAGGLSKYATYATPIILICFFHLFSGRSIFRESPLPLYFILATATLITHGLEGSDTNYFIEPFASALLLAGLGINLWTSKGIHGSNNSSQKWIGIFLMVLLLTQFITVRMLRHDEFTVMNVDNFDVQQGEMLVTLIKNTPGDVISEDASFQVIAGKPVVFEPYIMTLLAERGKWNQDGFVEDLENASFDLLILGFDLNDPDHSDRSEDQALRIAGFNRFSDEMEQAIRDAYEIDSVLLIHSRRNWFIYRPTITVPLVSN